MKYSIRNQVFNLQNKTVEFIKLKELTEDEFNLIDGYLNIITLHFQIEDYFLILKRNFEELTNFINKEYHELEGANLETFMNVSFLKNNRIEINRKLLNYLSSTRTFMDYMTRILKKHDLENYFTDFSKKMFDENFSYRFFYKLRNYAQHIALPLTWFSVDVKDLQTRKLIFAFDIKFLLEDYDSWSIVKHDLSKFGNNKLDLNFVSIKHNDNLIEIYNFCQKLFKSKLKFATIVIEEIIKEHPENSELVIFIEENIFTTRTIPISQNKVSQLKTFYNF